MTYHLDPELAAWAAALPKADLRDLSATREGERQTVASLPGYEAGNKLLVTDQVITGSPDVAVRTYVRAAEGDDTRPRPALIALHGGGFVFGGVHSMEPRARMLADLTGILVVAVEYRLAPEHPYPAGLEDAFAVLQWLAGSGAESLSVDPERIGVWGESAGGGIAAALTLLTRDRSGPALAAQFLDAPTVDDRLATHSMRTLTGTPMWDAANSPLSWEQYLGAAAAPGTAGVPLYAAPARAATADVAGLPLARVTTYDIDPTRDESLAYALKLMAAGVPTEIQHYRGAFHLAHMIPGTGIGARMLADTVAAVRNTFGV
ncbi:alpha/beta hydrolase [Streptomyces nodosus]|uniref:alpha/beta hydrolase n=1 Tax=Streptomyces nodosus TaxID=40318 RepID=UPI0034520B5F